MVENKATRKNPKGSWQSPNFPFHHAVVEPEGKRVHISGQVAWDENRNIIGIGDAGEQTKFAIASIENILASLGGNLADIISVNVFYTNQSDYQAICDARNDCFTLEHGPASTAVRVAGLVDPELLIEISAIAVIPQERFDG